MAANHTIRQLLIQGELIWSPCVYDCTSARIVEMCGYPAILLSSSELEFSMNGIPGGLYNWEEYIWMTERIASSSSLPLIVDGENGGESPMQVYRNCKRLAEAGAMAISIEDELSGGISCGYGYRNKPGYLEAEEFAVNIMAAVDAVKGTECMIIARTNCKGGGAKQTGAMAERAGLGLDEAIRRACMGTAAGAEITMIQDICHKDCEQECIRICQEVPGYHFYPDLHATGGQSDVTLDQLKQWGFHLVSNHACMKGATKGMLDYLQTNYHNQNTVYSENDEFDARIGHEFHPFAFTEWIRRDKKYTAYGNELKNNRK